MKCSWFLLGELDQNLTDLGVKIAVEFAGSEC
jgi:hypothetical protein